MRRQALVFDLGGVLIENTLFQELPRLLREAGWERPIYVHGALDRMNALYERHGIDLGPLEPATAVEGAGKTGVVVAEIDPEGTAAQKGIQTGDVILAVGGKTVSRPSDVAAALDSAKTDGKKSVLLTVSNPDGELRFVALSLQ